ncbi:hypothetical protein Gohar_021537, partial [Gossypium harknessii]|nr:hypothetical protein [Gossypium harknessii]
MIQSLEEIVTFIWSFGLEYRSSAEKHPQPRSMVRWLPPPQGWVKINVDARLHNLVHSVVIAEALVVLHELQFALDLGFTNVILESDSRL